MKNLKRILSLALACTMLVGMMVVGANAADFSDAKDIKHTEAVDTLVALGVIEGNGDGTFDPQGGLTRAAMAKMLAWVMNKGKDPAFADTDEPTFTDVNTPATRWAIPYIEYCYNLGYVSGDGGKGSTFRPNDIVKTTEFARALLNAMGYKLDSFENWEIKTEVQARGLNEDDGLYADLENTLANKPMTRDEAAQMLFNALSAPMAGNASYTADGEKSVGTGKYHIVAGSDGATGMDANLKKTAIMDMVFNSFSDAKAFAEAEKATGSTYGKEFAVDEIRTKEKISLPESLGHKYLSMSDGYGFVLSVKLDTTTTSKTYGKYKVTTDDNSVYILDEDCSDLIGEYIHVLYRGTDKNNVYGVFAISEVTFDGTVGEYVNKINALHEAYPSYGYDELLDVDVYAWNSTIILDAVKATAPGYTLKVAETDDDIHMVALPFTMGTVSYKTATNVTISGAGISNAKLSTVKGIDDVKQGDVVVVTDKANTTDGKYVVTKPQTVSGLITSVRGTGNKEVRIDGVWYAPAFIGSAAAGSMSQRRTLTLVNGYYVTAVQYVGESTASKDLVLVMDIATRQSGFDTYKDAKVLGLDGKLQVITFVDGDDDHPVAAGDLCNYTVKDNIWTLVAANATSTGYDKAISGSYNAANPTAVGTVGSGNTLIADDAVIVIAYAAKDEASPKNATTTDNVSYGTGSVYVDDELTGGQTLSLKHTTKYAVITGAQLKKWNAAFGVPADSKGFANSVNGIDYIQVYFLVWGSATTGEPVDGTINYGYVTADSSVEYVSATEGYYSTFKVWNGTEEITIKENKASNSFTTYRKGDVITYSDPDAKGIVVTVSKLTKNLDASTTADEVNKAAVTGYSASDKKIVALTEDKTPAGVTSLNDRTVVMYVNTTTHTGTLSSGLPLATRNAYGAYAMNILYLAGSDGVAKLIIVDEAGIGTTSTALTDSDLKALGRGTYMGSALGNVDASVTSEPKNNVFIIYNAIGDGATSKTYTLTVTNENDETVSTQEFATADAAAHMFIVNLKNGGYNGPGTDPTANMLTGSHTYTWTITTDTGSTLVDSGSYTYNHPAA